MSTEESVSGEDVVEKISKEEPQKEQQKPKKKHRLLKSIILLFVILLLALGGYFLYKNLFGVTKKESVKQVGFAQLPTVREAKADTTKTVTKAMGPAGGVLQVENGDFLYTLTVPPEALILPAQISLTPLTEAPFSGYEREDLGLGVLVGPDSNFLNQTAFLTVQKGVKKSTTEAEWDRCSIGSRGYDPEICAGEEEFPFNYGVDPGKVGLLANGERGLSFMPTIITGEENTVSFRIWSGGAYLMDRLNNAELSQIAGVGVENNSNMASEVEPMAQIMATGQSLEPYRDRIKDLKRSKSSYPRSIMEAAYLASAIGENDVANEKVEEFLKEYEQNFNFIRSAYLPWPSYFSTYHQLEILYGVNTGEVSFIPKAYAGKNKGTIKPNKPYSKPLNDMYWQGFLALRKDIIAKERETFEKENLSACEKIPAIEALLATLAATDADKEKMRAILKEAAKCCSGKEECQSVAKLARKLNDEETAFAAEQRMKDLEAKNKKTCTPGDELVHKQGLSDYGYNEPCEVKN